MGRKRTMPGRKFNRLLVEELDYIKNGHYYYRCVCECGNSIVVDHSNLLNGFVQSCGCLRPGHGSVGAQKHGLIYNSWEAMRSRCNYPHDKRYASYGGRGIKVCSEWGLFKNFEAWAYANGYQPGLTIDRIDNNGDYEPSNCQWLTRAENTAKRWRAIA